VCPCQASVHVGAAATWDRCLCAPGNRQRAVKAGAPVLADSRVASQSSSYSLASAGDDNQLLSQHNGATQLITAHMPSVVRAAKQHKTVAQGKVIHLTEHTCSCIAVSSSDVCGLPAQSFTVQPAGAHSCCFVFYISLYHHTLNKQHAVASWLPRHRASQFNTAGGHNYTQQPVFLSSTPPSISRQSLTTMHHCWTAMQLTLPVMY
jgi:hypothetical protein